MPQIWSRARLPFTRGRRARDPFLVRAGSPRKRDAYKVATAGLTGVTAFGALAVTGSVAGAAAHQKALQDAAKAATPAAPATQVVTKKRPHRTVVRTKVVHAASTSVARPATGGTVRSSTSSSSSGGTSTHSAPKPAPQPAPKPAPAPAPSSGS